MESDIEDIEYISDHVEIHPKGAHWCVVRDGSVYGTYADYEEAYGIAGDLAEEEGA